tara:strand:- start:402 stop:563 length:162 start_codon:yes stop_codon:yes gene_type:complete
MSILNKLQQLGSVLSRGNGATPESTQAADIIPVDSSLGLNGQTPEKYEDNKPQ